MAKLIQFCVFCEVETESYPSKCSVIYDLQARTTQNVLNIVEGRDNM